jgi:hypothetical protein
MSRSKPEGPDSGPDDGDETQQRDCDPSYPQHFPARVHRFRQLLAELIARRILAERRRPPDAGEPGKG